MSSTQPGTGRCPAAHGFDVFADAYYRDPALHLAAAREDAPVFWYERLHGWVVTRREDALRVLGDWQAFSSAATPRRRPRTSTTRCSHPNSSPA